MIEPSIAPRDRERLQVEALTRWEGLSAIEKQRRRVEARRLAARWDYVFLPTGAEVILRDYLRRVFGRRPGPGPMPEDQLSVATQGDFPARPDA
jgi:hypothetical protein